MNIVINNGNIFKKIINGVKEIITISEITFDKKGMVIKTMDDTHACLLNLFISESFFSVYDINGVLSVGVNFENFSDILKLSSGEDIKISYVPNSDKLSIDLSDTRTIKFEMNLFNSVQEPIEIEDLIYDYIVYINTKDFIKVIKDLSIFGDKCTIDISDTIIFTVNGDNGKGEFGVDDVKIKKINDKATALKLVYNLKFLSIFAKTNIVGDMILKLSSVSPFCCEYRHEEDSFVSYYLAQIVD